MLLVGVTAVNLIGWAIYVISSRKVTLHITPFTAPILGLGLVFILSSFFAANNFHEALMGRGTLFAALALVVFTLVNTVENKKFVQHGLYALFGGALILSLISIFQSLGIGLSSLFNNFFGTNIPDTLAFTPAGSPVALLSFLAPVLVTALILAFTRKENLEKVVLFLFSAIMTAALVLVLTYSFPGKDTAPVFLPMEAGYSIALETLKNPRRALLGYGPESFVNAYNRSRPANLNLSQYWNVRFTNSSNELFQAVTTTGILGLIMWVLIGVAVIKMTKVGLKSTEGKVIKFATIGLLFLLLLLPGTYLHLFTFFILIALWSILLIKEAPEAVRELTLDLNSVGLVRPSQEGRVQNPVAILPFLIGIPVIALAAVALWYTGKAYTAEVTFKKALDAAAQNDGVQTYNLQRDAIIKNPYISRYRRAYSVTNLALANSLAGKEDLNDQDRANITQLIQQAIREAKAAVTLDTQNASNWENLAVVYRSLINIAENAERWTLASMAQGIQNDPINPRLRLELGGVYYALGQYDQAIRMYQQAAELKPDWANAYYNLAAAHKQKKELAPAYDYMRQVTAIVDKDSADYAKAQQELEELASQLNLKDAEKAQTPAPEGDLQTPSPAPSPNPNAQVELPDNSGPDSIDQNVQPPAENTLPTPPATPSVTPQPTQTPQQ